MKDKMLAHQIAVEVVFSGKPEEVLKRWRMQFNIKQNELAAKLGITNSVISDYESGRRKSPGIVFLRKYIVAICDCKEEKHGLHDKVFP